jgi:hypothetical protein
VERSSYYTGNKKKKKKEIQFSQDSRGPKSPFFLGCAGVAGNDYPIYKIL